MEHSFPLKNIKTWNDLTLEIITATSVHTFKERLDENRKQRQDHTRLTQTLQISTRQTHKHTHTHTHTHTLTLGLLSGLTECGAELTTVVWEEGGAERTGKPDVILPLLAPWWWWGGRVSSGNTHWEN